MEKIKMTTPLVEMDGDEMTRILWAMIKDKLFCKNMVYFFALALPIRTVISGYPIHYGTFVKTDSVIGKRVYKVLLRSGNIAQTVRIFYTQIEGASALMCQTFGNKCGK